MAEEIGALRAVLALESAAFDKGVASARRQLTVLEGGLQRTGAQVGQFGQRMSRDATGGFRSLERSSNAARGGLQNFGFQVQDFAVQVAGGTSATRALSQQLPQLLSGFGLFGVLAGTAAAVLVPLVGYLFQAADATKSWVNELNVTGGSISGVTGAVSALKGVQDQYNDAITAQGGASSASAALVISNSAKEFAARKSLLAVEIQLLKIRGMEQQSAAANLTAGIDGQRDAVLNNNLDNQVNQGRFDGSRDRAGNTLDSYVNTRRYEVRPDPEAIAAFAKGTELDRLALQKLNAELTLTNLTVSETEKLMGTTFDTIAGGGGGGVAGAGGSGGGGGRSGGGAARAADAIGAVRAQTEALSTSATQLQGSFQSAFVDLVTGAKSAQEAVAGLLSELAKMLANSAFKSLMDGFGDGEGGGLLAGIGKALGFADGGAFANGRVQAFASGGIVNSPTVFPMANGAGLMGEAGPEAIMPLTRIGGKLGVRASGGGGATINIDARGAVEGTDVLIMKRLREAYPGLLRDSVAANRVAAGRGR